MLEFTKSPLFGIFLTIFAFELGIFLNKKLKSPFVNPLFLSIAFIIITLKVFNISLENYNKGGDVIFMLLTPATAILSVSIYSQLDLLKQNFIPVVIGAFVGSLSSIVSIFLLCKFFKLDNSITISMIPKSVTNPIAIELSSQLGGLVPITIVCVVISGICGVIFSPILIKILKIDNPISAGVAIGTSSHGFGTTKALEIGEVEGAMSGIAIGVAGIITVFLILFI